MIETAIKLFVIGMFGIMSPGPDFVLIFRNSLNYPRHIAFYTAWGICLGLLLHISLNIFGVGLIVQQSEVASLTIQYLGAAYLIWLGLKSLTSQAHAKFHRQGGAHKNLDATRLESFKQGLFTNLLNFKALLFFLSIFTQVVEKDTSLPVLVFYGMIFWVQSLIYWPSLVIVLQHNRFETFLARYQGVLNKIFGIILIFFGAEIALGY